MAISLYKIKKWRDMISNNSVHHVNQNEGRIYSKNDIKGYYNNLTEKVSRFGLPGNDIPKSYIDTGEEIYFSIEIFQYGLGAYDLFLMNKDREMLLKTLACADWAVENQKENGSWETFMNEIPEHPYSSMAQGEGISLLIRAYKQTSNQKYMQAAEKAKDFMVIPVEQGGTTKYDGDDVYLLEYTNDPLVLNGWIFSYWGLWDYYLATKDMEVKRLLSLTLKTMEEKLPDFDIGYWSKYDLGNRIASPFYHSLHIAQLKVLYELTGEKIFMDYAQKWERYRDNFFKRKRAFIVKAWQKIRE